MKVLLARPHDFVVEDMKKWLVELGVEPVRLSALAQLEAHAERDVAAVVVSTAVTSSVPATFGEALAACRRRFPRVPVVIAGLSAVASARAGFASDLGAHGLSLHGPEEAVAWNTPGVALYVQDADFKPERRGRLTLAARRHLRLPV